MSQCCQAHILYPAQHEPAGQSHLRLLREKASTALAPGAAQRQFFPVAEHRGLRDEGSGEVCMEEAALKLFF